MEENKIIELLIKIISMVIELYRELAYLSQRSTMNINYMIQSNLIKNIETNNYDTNNLILFMNFTSQAYIGPVWENIQIHLSPYLVKQSPIINLETNENLSGNFSINNNGIAEYDLFQTYEVNENVYLNVKIPGKSTYKYNIFTPGIQYVNVPYIVDFTNIAANTNKILNPFIGLLQPPISMYVDNGYGTGGFDLYNIKVKFKNKINYPLQMINPSYIGKLNDTIIELNSDNCDHPLNNYSCAYHLSNESSDIPLTLFVPFMNNKNIGVLYNISAPLWPIDGTTYYCNYYFDNITPVLASKSQYITGDQNIIYCK